MTRIQRIEAELNRLYDAYIAQVQHVASRVFCDTVKPMLTTHGATFIPGNGAWYLDIRGHQLGGLTSQGNDGRNATERALIDILSIEIPGMSGNDLGSLMDEYSPQEG